MFPRLLSSINLTPISCKPHFQHPHLTHVIIMIRPKKENQVSKLGPGKRCCWNLKVILSIISHPAHLFLEPHVCNDSKTLTFGEENLRILPRYYQMLPFQVRKQSYNIKVWDWKHILAANNLRELFVPAEIKTQIWNQYLHRRCMFSIRPWSSSWKVIYKLKYFTICALRYFHVILASGILWGIFCYSLRVDFADEIGQEFVTRRILGK